MIDLLKKIVKFFKKLITGICDLIFWVLDWIGWLLSAVLSKIKEVWYRLQPIPKLTKLLLIFLEEVGSWLQLIDVWLNVYQQSALKLSYAADLLDERIKNTIDERTSGLLRILLHSIYRCFKFVIWLLTGYIIYFFSIINLVVSFFCWENWKIFKDNRHRQKLIWIWRKNRLMCLILDIRDVIVCTPEMIKRAIFYIIKRLKDRFYTWHILTEVVKEPLSRLHSVVFFLIIEPIRRFLYFYIITFLSVFKTPTEKTKEQLNFIVDYTLVNEINVWSIIIWYLWKQLSPLLADCFPFLWFL